MPPRRRSSKARAGPEASPSVEPPAAAAAEPLIKDPAGLVNDLARARRLDAVPRILLSRLSPQAPRVLLSRLSPQTALIFAAGLAVGGAAVLAFNVGDSSASTSKPSPHASSKVSVFKRMTGGSLAEVLPYGSPGPLHDLIRREAYVTVRGRVLGLAEYHRPTTVRRSTQHGSVGPRRCTV